MSTGDFIGALVKFSDGVSDEALKRLSIKAFINFAKVQLQHQHPIYLAVVADARFGE